MKFKDYKKEHDLVRKELWVRIAYAYVNSSNSINSKGAANWADNILADFDKRFPEKSTSLKNIDSGK